MDWFYLIVFVFLNVFIWLGMQKINRHLATMSQQLGTAVRLLAQLNTQLGEQPRPKSSREEAVGAGVGDQ
jgi:hypothetical protein